MSNFRNWLEAFESQQEQKIQELWRKTFEALGVGGVDREDLLPWSLSKITFGQDNPAGSAGASTFKGKQAVLKRLTRANIFQGLKELNDPELAKNVMNTEQWLGTEDNEGASNASTTVSTLLEKLFGGYYQKLLNSHGASSEVEPRLRKAPVMPPQQNPISPSSSMPMPQTPQQPQAMPMGV